MDINAARSYATRENLIKDLTKKGLNENRPLIVRNDAGRWTAIFGYHVSGLANPPDVCHLGYMLIN